MKLWLLDILACPIDKKFPLASEIFEWEPILTQIDRDSTEKTQEKETPPSNKMGDSNQSGFNQRKPQVLEKKSIEEMGIDSKGDPIKLLIEEYRNGTKDGFFFNEKSPIEWFSQDKGEELLIRDALIIKSTKISQYLQETLFHINEIVDEDHYFIHDKSDWVGQKALKIIIEEIKPVLRKSIEYIPSISHDEKKNYFITQLKHHLEFLNYFKYSFEIKTGVIYCNQCKRWYPIIDSIPQLLPDNVRDEESDEKFREKWKKKSSFIPS